MKNPEPQMPLNVVIINGWAANSHWWTDFCQELESAMAAAGCSPANLKIIDIDKAFDVDEWLEYLESNIADNTLLIGWSLGGALATRFAARYPQRIAALVTLQSNPLFLQQAGWGSAMPENQFAVFRRMLKSVAPEEFFKRFGFMQAQGSVRQKPEYQALMEQGIAYLPKTEILLQGLLLLESLDVRYDLQKLQSLSLPCLCILGNRDMLVPFSVAEALKTLNPDARVRVLRGMGHLPMLQFTSAVVAEITRFLRSSLMECSLTTQEKEGQPL